MSTKTCRGKEETWRKESLDNQVDCSLCKGPAILDAVLEVVYPARADIIAVGAAGAGPATVSCTHCETALFCGALYCVPGTLASGHEKSYPKADFCIGSKGKYGNTSQLI
jgi:hypothetical protein